MNIEQLNTLESSLNSITQDIINLLISVENSQKSDPDKQDFLDEIQKIENAINTYSSKLSKIESSILLNNMKVDAFFNHHVNKSVIFDSEKHRVHSFSNPHENIPSSHETTLEKASTFKNIMNNQNEVNKAFTDNKVLTVSESKNCVFIPYTVTEIHRYLEQYPNHYSSFEDVVKKEFVLPLSYYMKHPVLARFRETYSLIRDREAKSVMEAFKYAFDLMFKSELNPTIIASCKTQEQLENYLNCLDNHKLEDFHDFEIKFEISPL